MGNKILSSLHFLALRLTRGPTILDFLKLFVFWSQVKRLIHQLFHPFLTQSQINRTPNRQLYKKFSEDSWKRIHNSIVHSFNFQHLWHHSTWYNIALQCSPSHYFLSAADTNNWSDHTRIVMWNSSKDKYVAPELFCCWWHCLLSIVVCLLSAIIFCLCIIIFLLVVPVTYVIHTWGKVR